MKKNFLKNIEWSVLVSTILLITVGMIALYSATQNNEFEELKKQAIWLVASIPVAIAFICIDYEKICKIAPFGYGLIIILLILVLFTSPVNGATSWFELGPLSFQPAEFAKIFVILVIALGIVKVQQYDKKNISKSLKLLQVLSILAVPVFLIIKQPDYGTALAFFVATGLMLFVAGLDKKYIIIAISLVVVILPILYFFVLPAHAKTRIDVFLNPNLDPRGARL